MALHGVESEVAGSVWKIEVAVGDRVGRGDVLMILESMKMEIPVVAPDGGRLVKLLVAEGDSVKDGQDLAVIETE